jgi:hypothetical protein
MTKKLFAFVCMFFYSYSGNALAINEEIAVDSNMTRPIEYVRVCSLYGAGFHFVPGTETCLQETTGITKRQTDDGTVEEQSELAQRVALLEAKLALISKHLGIE